MRLSGRERSDYARLERTDKEKTNSGLDAKTKQDILKEEQDYNATLAKSLSRKIQENYAGGEMRTQREGCFFPSILV